MNRQIFTRRRNQVSQAAFALSLFALSQSNFGDAAIRTIFGWTAAVYLWAEWIVWPILTWWFDRNVLAKEIAEMAKEKPE